VSRRHYEALVAESVRVGWPERHERDLTVHDRDFLASLSPGLPFAWILMRAATYLVRPSRAPIDRAGHRAEAMPRICEESFGREHCRFYWWDGCSLSDVGAADALAARLADAAR
jgi:hypothetical protein